jgi:hypothetical protein
MTMAPGLRKFALTAHVTASVGWLGAVGGSLALGVAGLTLRDAERVRAVYLTMELMGWFVLVPLSFASLLTGLVQSLGTRWGLLRHYWVIVKFGMNLFATTILLLYMQTLNYLARLAAETRTSADLAGLRSPSPIVHSAGALVLLLVAVTLSVYKPRGMTRYGQRKQLKERAASAR